MGYLHHLRRLGRAGAGESRASARCAGAPTGYNHGGDRGPRQVRTREVLLRLRLHPRGGAQSPASDAQQNRE